MIENEANWEYGVYHVDTYGWGDVQIHTDQESAERDFSTCGWNCSMLRRHPNEGWKPFNPSEVQS